MDGQHPNYLNLHGIDPSRIEPARIDRAPGFDSVRGGQAKRQEHEYFIFDRHGIPSDVVTVDPKPQIGADEESLPTADDDPATLAALAYGDAWEE